MIRWFLSTLLIAVVVAGVMIVYLSPDLRGKAVGWFKEKNQIVEKRVKAVKDSLPGESKLSQVKELLWPKTKPFSDQAQKPSSDQITDQDRKQLEQVLEQAEKVNPGQKK